MSKHKFSLDRYGNTANIWGKAMRKEYKVPDGYYISVSFQFGATGDTWPASFGRYQAILGKPTKSRKGRMIASYRGDKGHELAAKAAMACHNHRCARVQAPNDALGEA